MNSNAAQLAYKRRTRTVTRSNSADCLGRRPSAISHCSVRFRPVLSGGCHVRDPNTARRAVTMPIFPGTSPFDGQCCAGLVKTSLLLSLPRRPPPWRPLPSPTIWVWCGSRSKFCDLATRMGHFGSSHLGLVCGLCMRPCPMDLFLLRGVQLA